MMAVGFSSSSNTSSWLEQTFGKKKLPDQPSPQTSHRSSKHAQAQVAPSGGGVCSCSTWLRGGKGRVCWGGSGATGGGGRLANGGGHVRRRWWRERRSTWGKPRREDHSWGWWGPHWRQTQGVRVTSSIHGSYCLRCFLLGIIGRPPGPLGG